MFQSSKGDFIEPFLELLVKFVFKAASKHPHESNQLDFWDIFLSITILLIICALLYQAYKKIKKQP
jgi:hypothetical protein